MKNFKLIIGFAFITTFLHAQHWEAATPFPGVSGGYRVVTCMETYNNELIVGGSFTAIGGIVANSIARWNGVQWNNIGVANLLDEWVKDMIIYNNKLYFTADKLYVWDGVALQAVTYSNGSQQLNINGYGDLHVFNGDLYIVVGSSKLIKYNGVTAIDIALNYSVTGTPRCLEDFNNNLYLGTDKGLFKYQNNTWIDVSGISNTPPNIIDIETYNNELYVLGSFTSIGGISVNNIAKYNGSIWGLTSFPDNSYNNIVTNPLLDNNFSFNHLNVINNELYLAHYFVGSSAQIMTAYSPLIKFNGTNWIQVALNYSSPEGGCCSHLYNNSLYCGGKFAWLSDSSTDDIYSNKIGGIAKLNNTSSIKDISHDKQNTFPNPTSSEVKITLTQNQLGKTFKLHDNIGREKMSGVFNSIEYILNLDSFEPGIYFLKITDEDGQIKIIKN